MFVGAYPVREFSTVSLPRRLSRAQPARDSIREALLRLLLPFSENHSRNRAMGGGEMR